MSAVISLNGNERAELIRHEEIIARARSAFMEAGKALTAIRDSRLYRETHATFEDYCRERWQFEKSQVYRLMDSAAVAANLAVEMSPIGEVLPINEAQARPLAKLDPEEQREVWAEVVETAPRNDSGEPQITARQVEAAIERRSPHVANNSGENEWYTPRRIIELARSVMGGIDFDPASCELANESIQATEYRTKENSGLEGHWRGRVWMNPPYAQPLIAQFCEKAADEWMQSRIEQACVLVNNGTETAWGQGLLKTACAVCFPASRIRFIDKDGKPSGAPLQGQMIIYFGGYTGVFAEKFRELGACFVG